MTVNSEPRFVRKLLKEKGFKDVSPKILTDGQIGIYYVNTENIADPNGDFARYGDDAGEMYRFAIGRMRADPVFEDLVYVMADKAHELFGKHTNIAMSGGQRRDWLFSAPVAKAMEIPHISLYKQEKGKPDRIEVYVNGGHQVPVSIADFHVIHVADLLTEASSFYKDDPAKNKDCKEGWVPMLRNAGATISDALAVTTRQQGGEERLKAIQVTPHTFISIDEAFLRENSKDPETAVAYVRDPTGWSRNYLAQNGATALVDNFNPQGGSLDRAKKFLKRYGDFLKEAGRYAELSDAVHKKYGAPLDKI